MELKLKNQKYDKSDDLDEKMFINTQIIKLRNFLEQENNLNKVINFYKQNTGLMDKFMNILGSVGQNQNINLPFCMFTKYYDNLKNISYIRNIKYKIEPNIKKENNNTIIRINLVELYESRQEELGMEIFNIFDERKFYPLQKNELCFMTNFAKLNVIKWLIDIGFYNL